MPSPDEPQQHYASPEIVGHGPPKTSGKAIASLVLGLASFVCWLFTAIPGLILGILALRQINQSRGRLSGQGMAIAGIVLSCLVLLCTPIQVALVLPAIQSARAAAWRAQCRNNLRQIGLALHNYHDTYGSFPPAYLPDEYGRPAHSWRVLLLPFLDRPDLYDRYDFNEPWNGPNNSRLSGEMPEVFACPADANSGEGVTSYVVIVGPGTMFDGAHATKMRDVADGLSNTIAVIEANGAQTVWLEPSDLASDEIDFLVSSGHRPGTNVLLGDAAVRFLGFDQLTPATLRPMSTIAGGEPVY